MGEKDVPETTNTSIDVEAAKQIIEEHINKAKESDASSAALAIAGVHILTETMRRQYYIIIALIVVTLMQFVLASAGVIWFFRNVELTNTHTIEIDITQEWDWSEGDVDQQIEITTRR